MNQTLYQIGLWLVKQLIDTQAKVFKYKLTGVTDNTGKNIGNYEIIVKKIK